MPGSAGLVGALVWRTRREGVRQILATFLPFVGVMAITVGTALWSSGHGINGRAAFAAFATRYGATADSVAVGIALLLWPALVALFAAMAVASAVRNLVGAEATRGAMEALLAMPYSPATLVDGLLIYAGLMATVFWCGMMVVAAIGFALVLRVTGASIHLTTTYVAMAAVLPLLSSWAAGALALLVDLLAPKLAQLGGYGIMGGPGGLASLPPALPALGVLFLFVIGASHMSAAALLLVAGGAVAVIIVATVVAVARGFRPESILGA